MHQKRSEAPKAWPIPRKGSKYIAVADHMKSRSIPLIFILREILKIAKTRKEARYIILKGEVKVNNKVKKSETFPVLVFDVVNLDKIKKNYRLRIINRKFRLEEESGEKINKKIVKIIGKNSLGKGKIQVNLEDGNNFLTKDKFCVGDSAILNLKDNKIEKILPLKIGANIEVVSGKHSGERGILKEIENLDISKRYHIQLKHGEVSLPLKTIMVAE